MSQSFTCKRCGKLSKVSGIHYHTHTGNHYVPCEHCNSKNQLARLPTPQGGPALLDIVGIIKERT